MISKIYFRKVKQQFLKADRIAANKSYELFIWICGEIEVYLTNSVKM
ncbi:hypothetical protein AB0Y20_18695 [Heyndrickxia oleronia]